MRKPSLTHFVTHTPDNSTGPRYSPRLLSWGIVLMLAAFFVGAMFVHFTYGDRPRVGVGAETTTNCLEGLGNIAETHSAHIGDLDTLLVILFNLYDNPSRRQKENRASLEDLWYFIATGRHRPGSAIEADQYHPTIKGR